MGQITITYIKMAQRLDFTKILMRSILGLSIDRKKCLTHGLNWGGNKYFGTSSTLKDNINFWFYKKAVQYPSYPRLQDTLAQLN